MSLKDYRRLFENVPVPKVGGRPVGAQPVVPIEPMKGPWSGNQNLGSSRKWVPSEIGTQTIFRLPEWGMPRVWTVSLGIFKPEETGNNAYDFTALISFGVGGCVQLVEVDWVNGAMLQLPANAIDVVARQYNNQPPGYVIGATSDGIELSVTVAHGAIGTPSATRSIHFYLESTAVPASAYTFIKIPPFARYFIPVQGYQGNGLVTGADIEYVQCGSSWAGGGGPTVLTQTKGDTLFNFGGVVPLVPMAKYLRVANASAADVVSGVIVFGLAY